MRIVAEGGGRVTIPNGSPPGPSQAPASACSDQKHRQSCEGEPRGTAHHLAGPGALLKTTTKVKWLYLPQQPTHKLRMAAKRATRTWYAFGLCTPTARPLCARSSRPVLVVLPTVA